MFNLHNINSFIHFLDIFFMREEAFRDINIYFQFASCVIFTSCFSRIAIIK